MERHCNKMVVVCGLIMAFLLVGISCYVTEPQPASENRHDRRLVSRRLLESTSKTTLAYYLLSLQWPPSACATGMACMGHIPSEFTIHGLWPQNATGRGLPSYEQNPNCTTLRPVPPTQIYGILQKGNLVSEMTHVWPTLTNTESAQENQKFWEYQWGKHGMCSDYGDKPFDYFNVAINLRNYIVQVMKIESGKNYKVQEVVDKVKSAINGTPEIACRNKKGGHGAKIVAEVRICIKKGKVNPKGIMDCKRAFSGVCKNMTDVVSFV